VSRDESKSVLVPEDRTGRVLDRLILSGMGVVSGLSLVGAWLLAVRDELLVAGSLVGIALAFAWMIDQETSTPKHSLSRKLSQWSIQNKEPTPNTRLEPTRDHGGEFNSSSAQLRR